MQARETAKEWSDKASKYMTDAEKKMKDMWNDASKSNPAEKAKQMGQDAKTSMSRMGEDTKDQAGEAAKKTQRGMEDTGK
ncbi:hypothetical protein KEM54_006967 [Ascosphaera aggregata]|nr:hypothetical protein KEM54_006967 [Ascosphaera aggregata]